MQNENKTEVVAVQNGLFYVTREGKVYKDKQCTKEVRQHSSSGSEPMSIG